MSLLAKFSVLVVMLCIMMLIGIGMPAWAVSTVNHNVVRLQIDFVRLIESLDRIEEEFGSLREIVAVQALNELDRDEILSRSSRIHDAADQLEASPVFREIMGPGAAPSLVRQVRQAEVIMTSAVTSVDASDQPLSDAVDFLGHIDEVAMISGLVRSQLESNMHHSIQESGRLTEVLRDVFLSSLTASLLIAGLALLLLRRWVIMPVLEIRHATVEISKGNFDYRIASRSRDEIGALARDVNRMASTISSMQAKVVARERLAAIEEILRSIAHNLRNPLAGIRGLAETSLLELPKDSPIREDQSLIVSMVDQFERWLGGLLRSTSPVRVRLTTGAPAHLIDSVAQTLLPTAQTKSVAFVSEAPEGPDEADFDALQLEQALIALGMNAIEAAGPGGRVLLTSTSSADGEHWIIAVNDSGPGVSDEVMHQIFDPYFTTKDAGTGLGLPYALNVVRAHHGHIEVGRSDLGGARFEVVLPLRASAKGEIDGSNHGG